MGGGVIFCCNRLKYIILHNIQTKPIIMKLSHLLAIAALMPALYSGAAINNTDKVLGDTPDFLSAKYTFDKKTQLISVDNDYTYDGEVPSETKVNILDYKFNQIKTITIQPGAAVTATTTRKEALQGPKDIFEDSRYEDEYHTLTTGTQEEFEDFCRQNGFDRFDTLDGAPVAYPTEEYNYYSFNIYKYKYPQRYYIWRKAENKIYRAEIHYEARDYGFIGYGDPQTETRTYYPELVELYPRSEKSNDIDDIVVSQTLFNSDAAYEWIMPIFEAVEVSYSTEYEQVSGTEVKCTGISVVSENGATVASAKFPAGYYSYSTAPDIYLYDLDGTAFLVVSLREDDNSAKDDCYVVYELTDGGSSLKMVGTPMSVGVSPRAPRIGENVTVSLGEPAGKDCFVEVVSSTGRTVLRRKMTAGDTSTSINTADFNKGIYIVTVNGQGNAREAAKIIVR